MKYRRTTSIFILCMLVILAGACSLKGDKPAESIEEPAAAADDMTGAQDERIREFRDSILSYFTPVQALVVSVDENRVQLELEQGSVKKGMRLVVFREGDPFYHPVTNELLGRTEVVAGRLEVSSDASDSGVYPCRIVSGDVQAGDRARISASRIKLAFFQDKQANWSLSETFYGSLKESGRFEMAEAYAPDYEPGTLSHLARELGAEAVLMFSTFVDAGERMMKVKLYWAEDGEQFAEVSRTAQNVAELALPQEEFITRTFQEREPQRMFKLPGGRIVAMGNVDGEGGDELVVSNGSEIWIYGTEGEMRELWHVKPGMDGQHLSLDILDANGNGMAELFVTSVLNAGAMHFGEGELYQDTIYVNSFVLEYSPEGTYERVAENIPYFFRSSSGVLYMQGFNSNRIFSGPVYRGSWDGEKYGPGSALELPAGVNIYGFTFVDWKGEGQPDLISFDDRGYIDLYDGNGNMKWESKTSYGPFPFTFQSKTNTIANPLIKWAIRTRLSPVRTDRGIEVVAMKRNPLLPGVPGLGANATEVISLWWNGVNMEETEVLSNVAGVVTDYWVQGQDLFIVARADMFMMLGRVAEGEFGGTSFLYYYSFSPLDTAQ